MIFPWIRHICALCLRRFCPALLPLVAAAAAACASKADEPADIDPPPTQPAECDVPIMLAPTAEADLSRSPKPLQDVYDSYAIAGWKEMPDGSKQDVMLHSGGTPYEVRWADPAWTYVLTSATGDIQYLKFWDLAATTYHFTGFAPYEPGVVSRAAGDITITTASGAVITIRRDGSNVSISQIKGNVPWAQTADWAVVNHVRAVDDPASGPAATDWDTFYGSHLPPATGGDPPALLLAGHNGLNHDPVPLRFHGLMSGIEFQAFAKNEGEQVGITAFKAYLSQPIATGADFHDGTLTPSGSDALLCDLKGLEVTAYDDTRTDRIAVLSSLAEIPQGVTTLSLTVEFITNDGKLLTGTFELDAGWAPEKRYIYKLYLSAEDEIILVDVAVDKYAWIQGSDIDVPDDIDNW